MTGPVRLLLLAALAPAALVTAPAAAQYPTEVTTQIITDGTLPGQSREVIPGVSRVWEIGEGRGFRPGGGGNLFHSFEIFDLGAGDTALFTADPAFATENVISRVTGGVRSDIFGTIRSDIPDADFYFLNPAGVLFGPEASIDVPSSFHASTADSLLFSNGEIFEARPGGSVPVLDVAVPAEFGFLGDASARLVVAGSKLRFEGSVSLSAGSIEIRDAAGVSTTARSGEVADISIVAAESFELSSDLGGESRSVVATHGPGSIRVEAPTVHIDNGTLITRAGGDVVVTASESVTLAGGAEFSGILTQGNFSEVSGSIRLEAPVIRILDVAVLDTVILGVGETGSVVVAATESLTISGPNLPGFDSIRTFTFSENAAAPISLSAPVIRIENTGIESLTLGKGRGGDILVEASESIVLSNADLEAQASGIGGPAGSGIRGGDAGAIRLAAPVVRIEEQSEINSASLVGFPRGREPGGNGGDISIVADETVWIGGESLLTASTRGEGNAGSISIHAPDVRMQGRSLVTTSTEAPGRGGDVHVQALLLELDEGARINSESLEPQPGRPPAGNGGAITLDVQELAMAGEASVSATSSSSADAGSITIGPEGATHATRIVSLSESTIATSAVDGGGGDIKLRVHEAVLLDRGSTLNASVADGEGGSVTIESPEVVVLRDGSSIVAQAQESGGTGGRIVIEADGVFVERPLGLPPYDRAPVPGDSFIDASAPGGPEAQGTVEIRSPDTVVVSQVAPLRTDFLDASALLRPTCAARAAGPGAGGSFHVARRRGLPASPEGLLLAFDHVGDAGDPTTVDAQDDDLPPVAVPPDAGDVQVAQVTLAQATAAFRGGHFEKAREHWAELSARSAETGDAALRGEALRGLAHSQQALGLHTESVETLRQALEAAEPSGDPEHIAALQGDLANAYVALGQTEASEELFTRGIELAKDAGLAELAAVSLTNLGNLYAVRRSFAASLEAYEESAAFARAAGDELAETRALANAARATLEAGQTERAAQLLARAGQLLPALEATHEKVYLGIHLAKSYEFLGEASPPRAQASLLAAHAALTAAIALARELDEPRALSYGLGNLGALYQSENRSEEALYLTREAVRAAERAGAAESLYRWYWQEGQLLWAQGQAGEALGALRRSVAILEETRQETLSQYGSAELRFGRAVAPAYLELADVLLQGSALASDDETARRLLVEARATVERLKAAELRDYFRDECVADLEAKEVELDPEALARLSPDAAVVYPILLPDRLELLVSLPRGLERYPVDVSAAELERQIRAFGRELSNRTTRAYLPHAQQLYDWLVRPYAQALVEQQIGTLVFVPGGSLRTIPMAALHDGEQFLAQRFALAVTPGTSLVDPKPLDPEAAKLLLAGVSEAVQGFPALASVPAELEELEALYGGEVLLDEAFEVSRFEAEVAAGEPSVVHLASHAVFTGDPETSFLLTYDDRLTMDRLSAIVAPTQFRTRPLELLVLSACETAAGDEQAALGLAGVAIASGARSALGSLWRIDDEATHALMVAFYEELRDPSVSKAVALQRAQGRLIDGVRFFHPFYWSPFLLISNWL